MEFSHPAFFLFLLLTPVLYWVLKYQKRTPLVFSTLVFFRSQHLSVRLWLFHLLPFLRLFAFLLFIAALARPQRVAAEKELETQGIDIVISMDISGSMLAEDFKPENRLEIGKQEAKKFVDSRENDRIGLVVFARKAFTQCPLTLDYDVLKSLIDQVETGRIADGTAIGMGLATAVNRLRESDAKGRVIILITDGENNAGNIDPITAAELARTFGIKVYTIAVGRGGLVPFPVNDPIFGKRYVQANVEIDETALKRIADIAGGLFFRARDPQSLSQIYERINQLEKTDIKVTEYRSYEEFFPLFLLPALAVLAIEIFLSQTFALKAP